MVEHMYFNKNGIIHVKRELDLIDFIFSKSTTHCMVTKTWITHGNILPTNETDLHKI